MQRISLIVICQKFVHLLFYYCYKMHDKYYIVHLNQTTATFILQIIVEMPSKTISSTKIVNNQIVNHTNNKKKKTILI